MSTNKDPFDGSIYLKSKADHEKAVAFKAATMIKVYKKNEDTEEIDYE